MVRFLFPCPAHLLRLTAMTPALGWIDTILTEIFRRLFERPQAIPVTASPVPGLISVRRST